jgi:transcription termination/antitermination protein NusG
LRMTTERKLEASGKHLAVQEESAKPSSEHWYALYTRGHAEQSVYSQLAAKAFHVFLPKIQIWSRRAGKPHLIDTPMFPTYLFLRHAMDKLAYLEVRRVRGLVRILGEGWDRLGVVPDAEIEAIQKVVNARLPVLPHPYLKEGEHVRITDGPLEGTEGIFVRSKLTKGLLVLSVDLLQRSIAVEVDCSAVVVA